MRNVIRHYRFAFIQQLLGGWAVPDVKVTESGIHSRHCLHNDHFAVVICHPLPRGHVSLHVPDSQCMIRVKRPTTEAFRTLSSVETRGGWGKSP